MVKMSLIQQLKWRNAYRQFTCFLLKLKYWIFCIRVKQLTFKYESELTNPTFKYESIQLMAIGHDNKLFHSLYHI